MIINCGVIPNGMCFVCVCVRVRRFFFGRFSAMFSWLFSCLCVSCENNQLFFGVFHSIFPYACVSSIGANSLHVISAASNTTTEREKIRTYTK